MSKDAFYFSHDSNARIDPKMIRLRRLAGLAGYGLFWCVVEMLRDAPGYQLPLSMIEDLTYELRADQKTFDALFECGLLEKDENHFWSDSLSRRMESFEEKKEQAKAAGKASAAKRNNERSTDAERTLNDRSTDDERPLNDRSTDVQPKRSNQIKVKDITANKKKESECVVNPEIPFSEFLKEFSHASRGKKQPAFFTEAAKIEITRIWETLVENKCKSPAAVIKAVIAVAMNEMVLNIDRNKTNSTPMYYEPHHIFKDEQFNRYLSMAQAQTRGAAA